MMKIETMDGDTDEMIVNSLSGYVAIVNGTDMAIKGYTRGEDGGSCLVGVLVNDEGEELLERGVKYVPLDDITIEIY